MLLNKFCLSFFIYSFFKIHIDSQYEIVSFHDAAILRANCTIQLRFMNEIFFSNDSYRERVKPYRFVRYVSWIVRY